MKTIMSLEQLVTISAFKQFLEGTQIVAFSVATHKKERHSWLQSTLVKHHYMQLGKADKGTTTRYLMKVAGYSLAQTKRLMRSKTHLNCISQSTSRWQR
ncbi:MAG: hypothetical protein GY746_05875 [Gammaproteobacteria bacterium]|nr:hypothetical protein [Gammaproteobacteria bacterium]